MSYRSGRRHFAIWQLTRSSIHLGWWKSRSVNISALPKAQSLRRTRRKCWSCIRYDDCRNVQEPEFLLQSIERRNGPSAESDFGNIKSSILFLWYPNFLLSGQSIRHGLVSHMFKCLLNYLFGNIWLHLWTLIVMKDRFGRVHWSCDPDMKLSLLSLPVCVHQTWRISAQFSADDVPC